MHSPGPTLGRNVFAILETITLLSTVSTSLHFTALEILAQLLYDQSFNPPQNRQGQKLGMGD